MASPSSVSSVQNEPAESTNFYNIATYFYTCTIEAYHISYSNKWSVSFIKMVHERSSVGSSTEWPSDGVFDQSWTVFGRLHFPQLMEREREKGREREREDKHIDIIYYIIYVLVKSKLFFSTSHTSLSPMP